MFVRSVAEVIGARALPAIAPEATVRDAAHVLDQFDVGALVVVSGDRVVGLISERDILRRCIGQDQSPDHTSVAAAMTPDPITVRASDGLVEAIKRMENGHFRHLPVLDDQGRSIGLLSIRDIPAEYRMMYERFREMRG